MKPKNVITSVASIFTGLFLSHQRPCNIAAFHQGRSGSRLLGDLLKQHPRIVWEGELLSPGRLTDIASRWPGLTHDPLRILRLRMVMAGRSCFGFETQPTQVEHLEISLSEYVRRLEDAGFTHFLMLERKNHLRRIVSMLVARNTSQWHRTTGEAPPLVTIRLEVDNLLLSRGRDTNARSLVAQLEREQETWRELKEILGRRRLLYLSYEDDLAVRPETAYERVCEFAGLETSPVSVRFGKTNPHSLKAVLTNFGEVSVALSGTPYEWMLDA